MIEVALYDITRNGVVLYKGGIYIRIYIYTNAWVYRYLLELDGTPVRISLWFSHEELAMKILRLIFSDVWYEAVASLITVLDSRTNLKYTRELADINNREKFEKKLLKGVWLSAIISRSPFKAYRIISILENYYDVFINKRMVSKCIRSIPSSLSAYLITDSIKPVKKLTEF